MPDSDYRHNLGKTLTQIHEQGSRAPIRLWTLAIVIIGFLLGVVAALLSTRWVGGSSQNVLFLTLGSGFMSTAIISLMLDLVWSRARADEEKVRLEAIFTRFEDFTDRLTKLEGRLEAFKQLGLNYCHPSRGEALSRFLTYASEIAFRSDPNAEFVNIVSSSARGLIGHIDGDAAKVQREWRELITNKPQRFQVLLTHPAYAHLRQAAEERPSGEIELEILKTTSYLHCIAGMKSANLRFYRGSPTVFLIKADKHILLNPYPYGNMAMHTLSLEFESEGESTYVARFVQTHFNQTWKFRDQAGRQVDGQQLVQGVDSFDSILQAFSECTFLANPKRLRLTRAQIEELDYFVTVTLVRDYGKLQEQLPGPNPFMSHVERNGLIWSDSETAQQMSAGDSRQPARPPDAAKSAGAS